MILILQELDEALKRSESLAVHVVEVDLLEDRQRKAKLWVQQASDALVHARERTDHAVSMKELKDLLQSGQGLQVHGNIAQNLSTYRMRRQFSSLLGSHLLYLSDISS